MVLAYTSADELYDELTTYMEGDSSAIEPVDFHDISVPRGFEHIVTKTSPVGVFHGSINRS